MLLIAYGFPESQGCHDEIPHLQITSVRAKKSDLCMGSVITWDRAKVVMADKKSWAIFASPVSAWTLKSPRTDLPRNIDFTIN